MASRRGGQRVTASELRVLQEDATRVRNVCILAHVDHGKTTLSDGLVCSNGIISSKLAGKLRYLDSTEDEQKRGITMHSSAISLLYTAQSRQQKPGPLAPSRTTNGEVDSASGPGSDGTAVEGARATTVAKPESAADGDPGDTNSNSSSFLINLIDSPGHIDFSSDVSTATRLCDCALIVVDVLEGVCAQTHAVFRQARAERMRPLLVLNKVDRLASEVQLTPLEAWQHLQRLVENVNALAATLAAADELAELDGAPDEDAGEDGGDEPSADREAIGDWTFSPEKGDVVFCSALDGWGFGLGDFARLWAKRVGCKPKELRRMLWGSFVLNPKTKKVTKWTTSSQSQPMFVTMILDPIWKLYEAAFIDKNETKVGRMATKLGLDVPPRELGSSDPRTVLQAVMKRWLPVSEAVLRMVVEQGPPPSEAQADRVKVLWPQFDGDHDDGIQRDRNDADDDEKGIMQEMDRVRRGVASCDSTASAPVVIFVSKMVPVKRRDITDINGRPWRPARREFDHTEAFADGGRGLDGDSEDPDSLAFVAFARVLSGTVTPSTPLLVLGPKYHPLKPGAWRHASPVGGDNDWVSPPSDADTFSAGEPPQGQNPNRYHALREGHAERAMNAEGGGSVALYMMMGASLQPVPSVPAGNILALAGLEGAVNKCATLSNTPACPAMRAVTLQAKAMVRVAVEVLHQQDMDKLELGLSRLYQADPAVEVSVTARGEHVVACLGELHLEQCLKDLRERYAGVEMKASQPLVSFRETAVAPGQVVGEDGSIIPPPQLKMAPWAEEEGLAFTDFKTGRVRVVTPDRRAAFTLRCLPLPEDVAMLIEDHPKEVRLLWEDLVAARLAGNAGNGDETDGGNNHNPSSQHASINRNRMAAFREDLLHALEESVPDGGGAGVAADGDAGAGWNEGFLSRVLAFGPRNVGANILARCAGEVDVRVMMSKKAKGASGGEGVEESPALAVYAPGEARAVAAEANEGAVRRADVQEATEALKLVENSVVTGFQLATVAGPLGGEELHGLCFLLERVEVTTDCLSGSGGPTKAGAAPAPTGVSDVVPGSSKVGDGLDGSPASSPSVAAVDRNTREVAGEGRGNGDEEGSEEEGVRNGVVGVRGTESAGGETAASSAKDEARVPQHQQQQQQQQRRYGPLSGQVISVVRMGCRASMLCCPVRLVEAFYRCSLQCDQQQLGNMYAVLSKRRGRVVDEDLVEGTQLFLLTALLPVAESFGFANELLSRTSGSGTTPQLAFSHWEVMELDPFWRPQTSEEREDEGEEGHLSVSNIARQYLDRIRRRKGLASNEKIVVAAEKQRTLTRNK